MPALLLLLLSACALRDYVALGPTLGDGAFHRWMGGEAAPVSYTGPARVPFPVVPFQVFGLHYAEDIVLETDHPVYRMHEYARVEVEEAGSFWLAKDSDGAGVQTVTADLPGLETWMPEIPVPRRQGAVAVEDRSTASHLDLTLRYVNPLGEQVQVDFRAPRDLHRAGKRNGSTFNHSQQAVSAVLDIPRKQLGRTRARVTFDGREARVRRVLGLVPVKALLDQTQVGFAVTSMALAPREDGDLAVTRPVPGVPWPTRGEEVWRVERRPHGETRLSWGDPLGVRTWVFSDGGLVSATISAPGASEPFFVVHLDQPLPDLSRPFEGPVKRRFALQVNGQIHGHGTLSAAWDGPDQVRVDLIPLEPPWFAERPLQTRVRYEGEGATVTTERGR